MFQPFDDSTLFLQCHLIFEILSSESENCVRACVCLQENGTVIPVHNASKATHFVMKERLST